MHNSAALTDFHSFIAFSKMLCLRVLCITWLSVFNILTAEKLFSNLDYERCMSPLFFSESEWLMYKNTFWVWFTARICSWQICCNFFDTAMSRWTQMSRSTRSRMSSSCLLVPRRRNLGSSSLLSSHLLNEFTFSPLYFKSSWSSQSHLDLFRVGCVLRGGFDWFILTKTAAQSQQQQNCSNFVACFL